MRRSATLSAWVLSVALLVGCSDATEPAFSIFVVDQAVADRIPVSDSPAVSKLDLGSTRLLGDFSGYTFYAARQAEVPPYGSLVCLVVVPDGSPDLAVSTCTAGVSPELGMDVPGAELMLVPDTFDGSSLIEDGWTRVHRNLLAL